MERSARNSPPQVSKKAMHIHAYMHIHIHIYTHTYTHINTYQWLKVSEKEGMDKDGKEGRENEVYTVLLRIRNRKNRNQSQKFPSSPVEF